MRGGEALSRPKVKGRYRHRRKVEGVQVRDTECLLAKPQNAWLA